MLTDIEFAGAISDDIAREYKVAKHYVQDVPAQALLQVRSIAHRITELIADSNSISLTSANLYSRIDQLNQQRIINVRLARALHKLRGHGNRGAHPEKFHLTELELLTLAKKAISELLHVFQLVYLQLNGQAAPAYKFVDYDELAGRELCYRAVMEGDAKAQYLLGMLFKNKGLIAKEQEQALQQQPNETDITSSQHLKNAAYWFSQASAKDSNALFEYGVALIHGYTGEAQLLSGQQYIIAAANKNVVDAMALLGYFYLVGADGIDKNEVKAEQLLKQAAAQEHPEALANLGVLYYQHGKLHAAFENIMRAAKVGFPHAQYHLSLMLANGEGCEIDLEASKTWLTEAAEQAQLDAMLVSAQQMLNDEQSSSDLSKAEYYLRQVIRYGHNVTAMIELAIALTDGSFGRIDVVEAAAWLKLAKERANEQTLAIITPLQQSLKQQVINVIQLNPSDEERRALQRAQELLTE